MIKMQRRGCGIIVSILLGLSVVSRCLAAPAVAAEPENQAQEPLYLSGKVGTTPVLLTLDNGDGVLVGGYTDLSLGREMLVEGKLAADGTFTLDGFLAGGSSQKEWFFSGTVVNGRWTGTWRKPSDKAGVAVTLGEDRDAIRNLTIGLQCVDTEVDRRYGYTYKRTLTLNAKDGALRKFMIDHSVTAPNGDGDGGCAIGLGELRPAGTAGASLLLQIRKRREDETRRCTVRLISAGDHLLVRIGDPLEDGNDCREGSGVMYCSTRAFWSGDMIVDRRTRRCKVIE
jgi:hypothetical protein